MTSSTNSLSTTFPSSLSCQIPTSLPNLEAGPLIQSIFEKAVTHKDDIPTQVKRQYSNFETLPYHSKLTISGVCISLLITIVTLPILFDNTGSTENPASFPSAISHLGSILRAAPILASLCVGLLVSIKNHLPKVAEQAAPFCSEVRLFETLNRCVSNLQSKSMEHRHHMDRADFEIMFTEILSLEEDKIQPTFFSALKNCLSLCKTDSFKKNIIILVLQTIASQILQSVLRGDKTLEEAKTILKLIGAEQIFSPEAYKSYIESSDAAGIPHNSLYSRIVLKEIKKHFYSEEVQLEGNRFDVLKSLQSEGLDLSQPIGNVPIERSFISKTVINFASTLIYPEKKNINVFKYINMRAADSFANSVHVRSINPALTNEQTGVIKRKFDHYVKEIRNFAKLGLNFHDHGGDSRAKMLNLYRDLTPEKLAVSTDPLDKEPELNLSTALEECIYYLFLYTRIASTDPLLASPAVKKDSPDSGADWYTQFKQREDMLYAKDPGKAILTEEKWQLRKHAILRWEEEHE